MNIRVHQELTSQNPKNFYPIPMSDRTRANLRTAMASRDVVAVSDFLHVHPEALFPDKIGVHASCIFDALTSSIEVFQACLHARPECITERFVGGETLLMRAVIEHSPAFPLILERLLKYGHGQELLVMDKYGHEVMYYAYMQGNAEMVSALWDAFRSIDQHKSVLETFNRPLATGGICLLTPLMNHLNHTDDMTERVRIMLQWGANGIGSMPAYLPDHPSVQLLMDGVECSMAAEIEPQPARTTLCACL